MTAFRDMNQAPRPVRTTFKSLDFTPRLRSRRSRPSASCHRNQKHFRMCRRIQPSRRKIGCRTSASWKYPHQPRTYCSQLSRSSLLVRLCCPRHISRTFDLNLSTLSGAIPIRPSRSSRKPRNFRSHTLPVPLLAAFTCNRRCFSIQACIEASVRSAAA